MTGEAFSKWMDHMGFNILGAAASLGLGRNTITKYKAEGASGYIALACSALAMNLPKWGESLSE